MATPGACGGWAPPPSSASRLGTRMQARQRAVVSVLRHAAACKVRAQHASPTAATEAGEASSLRGREPAKAEASPSSSQPGFTRRSSPKRPAGGVNGASKQLRLQSTLSSEPKLTQLVALLTQQPGPLQRGEQEVQVQVTLLLELVQGMQTEELVQALHTMQLRSPSSSSSSPLSSLPAPGSSSGLNWRLIFAVVRLLGERSDLCQAMGSAAAMQTVCEALEGLLRQGIQPRCRGFHVAAHALLTSPTADLTMEQQASILSCLAAMPQRQAPPPASLLAIIQHITAVASFQQSILASSQEADAPGAPAAAARPASSSSSGPGATVGTLDPAYPSSPLGRAVGSLCRLLKQQRMQILRASGRVETAPGEGWAQQGSSSTGVRVNSQLGAAAASGAAALGSDEAELGPEALGAALAELSSACAPLVGVLGPEAAGSLSQACGLLGACVPVGMVQAVLSEVQRTGAGALPWNKALSCSIAALDAGLQAAEVEQLRRLLQQAVAPSSAAPAGAAAALDALSEGLVERLFQQRQEGQPTCSMGVLTAVGQVGLDAAAAGACGADALAAAARCLAEAAQARGTVAAVTAGPGAAYAAEPVLQALLQALESRQAELGVQGCCDTAMACIVTRVTIDRAELTTGPKPGRWSDLEQHTLSRLTLPALQELPARRLVALLHLCSTAPAPPSLASGCMATLVSLPTWQLQQQLSSPRKLQLTWTALRLATRRWQPTLPQPQAPSALQSFAVGAPTSSTTFDSHAHIAALLDHALHCATSVCHLLSPWQVCNLLDLLATASPPPTAATFDSGDLPSSSGNGLASTAPSTSAASTPTPRSAASSETEDDRSQEIGSTSASAVPSGASLLLPRLSALLLYQLSDFSDSNLVYVCTRLARLRYRPGFLLRDIGIRLLPSLPALAPQLGVWLLWSLAKLDHAKPLSLALARCCLALAQRHPPGSMRAMTPSQLATVVWACGRLGYRNDQLLKPVLQLLIRADGSLTMRLISNVVWACARLGYATERLSTWAVAQLSKGDRAAPPLATASLQTIANMSWGLWRLGHQPRPEILDLICEAAERCMLAAPGESGARGAAGAAAAEVTSLLSALSGWRAHPSTALLTRVEGLLVAAAKSPDGCGSGPAAASYVGRFDAQMLAGCVWALVRLGHLPARRTLRLVCGRVQELLAQREREHRRGMQRGQAITSSSSSERNAAAAAAYEEAEAAGAAAATGLDTGSSSPSTRPLPPCSPSSKLNRVDTLIGDLLWACFKCGFSPPGLLSAWAASLHRRLLLVGKCRPKTNGDGAVAAAAARNQGLLPGYAGIAAAALGLGLHNCLSASASGSGAAQADVMQRSVQHAELARLIEGAAIIYQSQQPGISADELSKLVHGLSLLGHVPRSWLLGNGHEGGLVHLLDAQLPSMTLPQLSYVTCALVSWSTFQLLPQAQLHHLLHQRLAPALEARVGAALAASASQPPAVSTTVLMHLIIGLATLGLYRQPVVSALLTWLTQPVTRVWGGEGQGGGSAPGARPGAQLSVSGGKSMAGGSGTGIMREGARLASVASATPSPSSSSLPAHPSSTSIIHHVSRLETLSSSDLAYLVWSLASLRHDSSEVLSRVTGILLTRARESSSGRGSSNGSGGSGEGGRSSSRATASGGSEAAPSPAVVGGDEGGASPTATPHSLRAWPASGSLRLSTADVVRLLWGFAKLNRNPGPELLGEVHRQWVAATSTQGQRHQQQAGQGQGQGQGQHQGQQQQGQEQGTSEEPGSPSSGQARGDGLQFHEVTVVLYSLAVLREHTCPLACHAARQLADMLATHQRQQQQQQQQQQLRQSTAASSSGGLEQQLLVVPASSNLRLPVAFQKQLQQVAAVLLAAQAERQISPLSAVLPPEAKALAIQAWREHVARKAKRKPKSGGREGRYQLEVASAAERLGLLPQLRTLTPDGVATPDVLVGVPQIPSARFALEMVGRHNAAANSLRVLGEATIKYRLLQARGYIVVPIPCSEWDSLKQQEVGAQSLYLQNKLDRVIAAAAAAKPAAVGVGGGPGGPSTGAATETAGSNDVQHAGDAMAAEASSGRVGAADEGFTQTVVVARSSLVGRPSLQPFPRRAAAPQPQEELEGDSAEGGAGER